MVEERFIMYEAMSTFRKKKQIVCKRQNRKQASYGADLDMAMLGDCVRKVASA